MAGFRLVLDLFVHSGGTVPDSDRIVYSLPVSDVQNRKHSNHFISSLIITSKTRESQLPGFISYLFHVDDLHFDRSAGRFDGNSLALAAFVDGSADRGEE